MTRATLTVETKDGPPIVAEFDVLTDDQTVTITIKPSAVEFHTKDEPKLVTS